MDEQRLPFPIAGTRTSGDGDPALGRGDAARLLYLVNLIADTAGVPVYGLARQTPYGMVTASVHGPLAFKSIRSDEEAASDEEEEAAPLVRLVWLPEGFVITPRSSEAPDGYGMPPTPNKRGTAGGPIREVILNRFRDNQYPDALFQRANGPIPDATRVCAANLFYMDWEVEPGSFSIGMPIQAGGKRLWRAQFVRRFETNFSEPETAQWHCHRPSYASESALHRYLREQANMLRTAASVPPLSPPLRGTEGLLSESPIYMAGWSGIVGHDSRAFRPGHQDFTERSTYRDLVPYASAENLFHASASAGVGMDFARMAMDGWRNSPEHYATLTTDWAEAGEGYASVDSAIRPVTGKKISGVQLPPYGLDAPVQQVSPPQGMVMATQIFSGRLRFVDSGACGRELPGGKSRVGLKANRQGAAFMPPFRTAARADPSFRPPIAVAFKGRTIPIWEESDGPVVSILAAKHIVVNDKDVLRVVTLERALTPSGLDPDTLDGTSYPAYVVVRDGAVNDYVRTQRAVEWFQIPPTSSLLSNVKLSESGNKAVFCYAVPEPHLSRFGNVRQFWDFSEGNIRTDNPDGTDQYGNYTGGAGYVWGEVLHFVEWKSGSGFSELFTDSIDIEPTYSLDGGVGKIKTVCSGSYKLFADYEGERLVYATVHVDSELSTQATYIGANHAYYRKLFGKIVFPNGEELVYVDTITTLAGGVSGTYAQILWMDILRPQDVVVLSHALSGGLRPASRCSIVSRGKTVKTQADVIAAPADDMMFVITSMDYSRAPSGIITFSAHHQSGLKQYVSTTVSGGGMSEQPSVSFTPLVDGRHTPPFPYKAALAGLGFGNESKAHGFNLKKINHFDLVGPEIHSPILGVVDSIQAEFYRGEAIVAGKVGSPFDLPGRGWVGEDQYFYESSLDLKAITGIPDLKDNILPIGAI